MVENGFVQLGFGYVPLRYYYRASCCWCRSSRAHKRSWCRCLGELDDGIGFAFDLFYLRRVELEQGFQFIQKAPLRFAHATVSFAHTHCHLVGKLAFASIGQCVGGTLQVEPFEQHVLIELG